MFCQLHTLYIVEQEGDSECWIAKWKEAIVAYF